MHTEKYLSFTYQDESDVLAHPFQYRTSHTKAYYVDNLPALRSELDAFFYYFLYEEENEVTDRFDFLDYHLNKYTGHGRNFLEFIKHHPMQPMAVNAAVELEMHRRMQRRTYLEEWLELRREVALQKVAQVPILTFREDKRLVVKYKGHIYSAPEIEIWFARELLHKTFNGAPVITPEAFNTFLQASFAAFGKTNEIPDNKKLEVNADGAYLKNVMHRFFKFVVPTDGKNKPLREGLVKILKNHFALFEGQDENTIYRSMGREYFSRS